MPCSLAVQAAREGRQVVYTKIEKRKIVPERTCSLGSPLHIACTLDGQHKGSALALVRALLQAEANVNCRDDQGATPLMKAACSGNTKALAMLLDAGASLRYRDQSGRNALHWAAASGHHKSDILSTPPTHSPPHFRVLMCVP